MGKQRGSEAISTDRTRPAREGKRTKHATVEKQLAEDRANGGRSPVANEAKQRAAQDVAVPIAAKEDCAAVCRSTLAALERFAKDVEALTVDDGGARRISTFPAAARLNASYQNAVHAHRLLGERLVEVYGKRERFDEGKVLMTASMKYGKGGAPLILGSATQALAVALAWPSTLPGLEKKDGREVFAPRFKFGYRIEAPEWESLKTAIKAVKLHVEEAHGATPDAAVVTAAVDHATDFTWLKVGPRRYDFSKGNQALTIEALYKEWIRGGDGAGLSEIRIGELIRSDAERFRVQATFNKHPALRTILKACGTGVYALYLSEIAKKNSE